MKNKKLLYFFNHPAIPMLPKIYAGEIPRDRLYGMTELIEKGWSVDACDERLTKLEAFFRKHTFSFINFATIIKCFNADILIVKDNFSLGLTICAHLFRKKIIYLDSLFYIPKNPIRRALIKINLMLAPTIVSYSKYQVDLWCKEFRINRKKFVILPYTIDVDFYTNGYKRSHKNIDAEEPFILATGRDTGRDFKTLVHAANKLNLNLKLVTLPYLIPSEALTNPKIEILQYVSYEELFDLYAQASIVSVPLRAGIDYPSGIRAVLESMLLGKPTICTHTPILEEYIPTQSDALIYVKPEDEFGLTNALKKALENHDYNKKISINGQSLVRHSYGMDMFTKELEELIISRCNN